MMHDEIPEQTEDVRGRPVAVTIGATVAAILACGVIVWLLLLPSPPQIHDGTPTFDTSMPLERERAAQRAALDTWTWADPQHTRVRMPVNLAIDRYLQQRGQR
jgi:hypothetical protein